MNWFESCCGGANIFFSDVICCVGKSRGVQIYTLKIPLLPKGNFVDELNITITILAFKNILNMDPKNGLIWAEYGTVLTKLANYREGRDAYLKALEFKPDSPRVHLSLGHVYKTIGDIDNSIKKQS